MKALRLILIGLLVLIIAASAAGVYAYREQTRLVRLVLDQVSRRTGITISITGSRLAFSSHLSVVLLNPRLSANQREMGRFKSIRVTLGYRALTQNSGLPLYAVAFHHGAFTIPTTGTAELILPRRLPAIDGQTIERWSDHLNAFSGIAQRIDLDDVAISDPDGQQIVRNLAISAREQRRRAGHWPWYISFAAEWMRAPAAGVHVSGNMRLGYRPRHQDVFAAARLWFWDVDLAQFKMGNVLPEGRLQGTMLAGLAHNGQLSGNIELQAQQLSIGAEILSKRLEPRDYTLKADYRSAHQRTEITQFTLDEGRTRMLSGNASLVGVDLPSASLSFTAGGLSVPMSHFGEWLRYVRGAPAGLIQIADRLRSGNFVLSAVGLKAPMPLNQINVSSLRQDITAAADLSHVSYSPLPDWKVPPLEEFEAQLAYAGQTLKLEQGTAQIGASSISDLTGEVVLSRAPAQIPYRMKAATNADLGEVFAAAKETIEKAEPKFREYVETIAGTAPVTIVAQGTLRNLSLKPPDDYKVSVRTGAISVKLARPSRTIVLKSGRVEIEPRQVRLDHIVAVPSHEPDASAVFDGSIFPAAQPLRVHDLTVQFHQIDSALWMPLLVDPDAVAVRGSIGGELLANSDASRGALPIVTGKIVLSNGAVQFGFLRSEMITNSAIVTLDGKGVLLEIPSAALEGSPLQFRMAVADISNPSVRIDAKVSRLNFEVMRFIRLPWFPRTPPSFFPVPVQGHIAADEGNFDKLKMSEISTDFSRNNTEWHVTNFTAHALSGRMDLDISGRARDDWINIKAKLLAMSAAQLLELSGGNKEPALSGTLFATGDLWANTDVDFFNTLAGSLALQMTDGRLNRFTLLTRILSLIQLKNLLTANFSNLSQTGIPFTKLNANFAGRNGGFETDDLRMDGPVMDIVAAGTLDLGDHAINMEVGMIPFSTVEWIVKQVPIIGQNVANGSSDLVAAYFHVEGPLSNPSIIPKPITSVAEFVIKTLALPINILKPNTIK